MVATRRQAREEALQILYAREINPSEKDWLIKDPSLLRADGSPLNDFTIRLLNLAEGCRDECINCIKNHALNWEFERIAMIDRLILRLAITEFLHCTDIPPKVTINEALEIARKFSTTESVWFINGVLDSVHVELSEH